MGAKVIWRHESARAPDKENEMELEQTMAAILVIEDEKDLLQLIQHGLMKSGFQVEIAANGRDGIRKFDDGDFDLVITDYEMPDIDGGGVARHIRATRKQDTPIICISGAPWLAEIGQFSIILTKPFTMEALTATIRNNLPPSR